MVYQNKSYC